MTGLYSRPWHVDPVGGGIAAWQIVHDDHPGKVIVLWTDRTDPLAALMELQAIVDPDSNAAGALENADAMDARIVWCATHPGEFYPDPTVAGSATVES